MSDIKSWSSAAAGNDAAAPNGFPEGMAPSGVNDAARELMAAVRRWYEDAEWTDHGHAPVYVSATSFTVSGDHVATYGAGRRLKLADAATLYGAVSASSYTAPNTTVTVALDSGSLTAALSGGAVGILKPGSLSLPTVPVSAGGTGATTAAAARASLAALGTAGGALSGALNEAKGADIASAATTDIGAATGNYVEVTGTTMITALGTVQAGTRRIVRFTGALTLTHNATSLILPTGANIATAANDIAEFVSLGSGNWICTRYMRANGKALATHAVFTKSYDSGDQTITSGGALTLAHGLGTAPKLIAVFLHCLTAEAGYSVGDYVAVWVNGEDAGNNKGVSVVPDATNLNVRFGSDGTLFAILNKSTGARTNLTNSQWAAVFRAWA